MRFLLTLSRKDVTMNVGPTAAILGNPFVQLFAILVFPFVAIFEIFLTPFRFLSEIFSW